jgi:hypothetical protein
MPPVDHQDLFDTIAQIFRTGITEADLIAARA